MKQIEDQFHKCKDIFVQNKIFVPILIAVLLSAVVVSFSFGQKLSTTENKIESIEEYNGILLDIKKSVDSLVAK